MKGDPMFIFLSKVLPQLVLPLGASLLCIVLLAWLVWRRRRGAALGAVALVLGMLGAGSMPGVSEAVLTPLETEYPLRSAAATGTADAIVILGGSKSDRGARLLYGFRLYKRGKAPLLILSGGALYP